MGQVLQWIFFAAFELVLMGLTACFLRMTVGLTKKIIKRIMEF